MVIRNFWELRERHFKFASIFKTVRTFFCSGLNDHELLFTLPNWDWKKSRAQFPLIIEVVPFDKRGEAGRRSQPKKRKNADIFHLK